VSVAGAKAEAKQAAQSPWVDRAARLGHVAKALSYAIVGLLAIQIPLGLGGETTDRQGALRTVAQEPFGEVLLLALGVGLAAYALWRLAQGLLDREGEGTGPKALAKRASYLARAAIYGFLAFVALAVVVGVGSGSGNEKEEAAKVLDLPLGRWIVGGVGLGFLVAGLYNGYRSLTGKFRKHLREHELDETVRGWVIVVGVVGHAARAVVFGLIGVFLVKAAWEYDPSEAIGLDGALRKLAQQSYGELWLGLAAGGLLAYALFCLVQARYRRV
jgi:Domain of Unknown Function (DUF1206)